MGRTLGLVAVIAAGLLSTGCIFVGGGSRASTTASRVTPAQVEDMIGRTRGLRVGMPREDALGLYPAEHLNLKSSTTAEGGVFEEWQVEAYSRTNDVYFRRYLYFADGSLAAFSDSRVEYRENPEVLRGWAGS